jgi:hypothetical protein
MAMHEIWCGSTGISRCLHVGANGFAEDEVQETIEEIRTDPNAYYVGMGDWLDLVGPTDRKRWIAISNSAKYGPEEQLNLVGSSMRDLKRILKPILNKEKCVGMMVGNHEWQWVKRHHYNPIRDLAEEVDCLYMGISSHILFPLLDVKSRKYDPENDAEKFFFHHGKGSGVTVASAINNVLSFRTGHEATGYMTAHVHKASSYSYNMLGTIDPQTVKRQKVDFKEIPKVCCTTGGYLYSYPPGEGGYAEERGYEPVMVGSTKITMQYKKKKGRSKYKVKYRVEV